MHRKDYAIPSPAREGTGRQRGETWCLMELPKGGPCTCVHLCFWLFSGCFTEVLPVCGVLDCWNSSALLYDMQCRRPDLVYHVRCCSLAFLLRSIGRVLF